MIQFCGVDMESDYRRKYNRLSVLIFFLSILNIMMPKFNVM